MKQRKSSHVQRGSIRVVDALVVTTLIGGMVVTAYDVVKAIGGSRDSNCLEWRQDLYETRELCQLDHPQYSCLDRDAATGKWLGTTYAKNICSSSSAGGGSGSYSSAADHPPDGTHATRSISRGGFGGGHGSGGG